MTEAEKHMCKKWRKQDNWGGADKLEKTLGTVKRY